MSSATSDNEDDPLVRRAAALCAELGYAERPTFYDALVDFRRAENLHVVTTAFNVIGIHAVFGIAEGASAASFKPVAYVGLANGDEDAIGLHRRVWTQGAVPFLLVVTPEGVQLPRERHRHPTGLGRRGSQPLPPEQASRASRQARAY
jgi:hypothetical protein